MKTLDEVLEDIDRMSDYNGKCDYCPYEKEEFICSRDHCVWYDALYYLKEYRSEKAMWEADRKGYLDWIEQYKEAREKHQQAVIELKRNPPLTWNELKQMEGKPVWIQEGDHGYWIIIDNFSITSYGYHWLNSVEGCLEKEYMGISWQAYRKEKN